MEKKEKINIGKETLPVGKNLMAAHYSVKKNVKFLTFSAQFSREASQTSRDQGIPGLAEDKKR